MRYLVRLVIVLNVVFEHFRLLFVVKVFQKVVHAKVFPPFLAINEPLLPSDDIIETAAMEKIHLFGQVDVEFPCPQEP